MDVETRISRIEERLTWLQRHVAEQDRVISSQAFEINALKAGLLSMKRQMDEGGQAGSPPQGEQPPHY